ncbi:GNAT family N-acetyltransferase [Mesocricetibacter intestinalis]|uniref:GNAT family N-acetyltransferase n=1 Tax=Mesocricetibacter intestinalis TaxID=1521930 RepID=UPI001060645D
MPERRIQILISAELPDIADNVLLIGEGGLAPEKAKNLLGREFENILFDARYGLNAEALAIAAGTLKAGGLLVILFAHWDNPAAYSDQDSLRWSGEANAIAALNFFRHFQACVSKYEFPLLRGEAGKRAVAFAYSFSAQGTLAQRQKIQATAAQQQILQGILSARAEIYFLTAKRGRGKSALAGMLAARLREKVYLTAPNKQAAATLMAFAPPQLEFIAPDALARRLFSEPQLGDEAWLLVDEAAMIPLPLLEIFGRRFKHILFTTTLHSYEGTGRGFELKFRRYLRRSYESFELEQPLRWRQGDMLEAFIEDLLLLRAEDEFPRIPFMPGAQIEIARVEQTEIIRRIGTFYGLLVLAHYRTSVLDLRRLFDAGAQRFYRARAGTALIGAVWALEEGGIADEALIRAIQRGQRRPKGHLVAQVLASLTHCAEFCRLNSVRISRIAIQPDWQKRGIGRQLLHYLKAESETDFLSVSFGYHENLWRFWRKCGFIPAHIGEHKEASSGCYTIIMLYPLSEAGRRLCKAAQRQFERNIGLGFHPLRTHFVTQQADWSLQREDRLSLRDFACYHRSLAAATPAIRRLLATAAPSDCPLLRDYLRRRSAAQQESKAQIALYRQEIGALLQKLSSTLTTSE